MGSHCATGNDAIRTASDVPPPFARGPERSPSRQEREHGVASASDFMRRSLFSHVAVRPGGQLGHHLPRGTFEGGTGMHTKRGGSGEEGCERPAARQLEPVLLAGRRPGVQSQSARAERRSRKLSRNTHSYTALLSSPSIIWKVYANLDFSDRLRSDLWTTRPISTSEPALQGSHLKAAGSNPSASSAALAASSPGTVMKPVPPAGRRTKRV
jgi:hypothetical protein